MTFIKNHYLIMNALHAYIYIYIYCVKLDREHSVSTKISYIQKDTISLKTSFFLFENLSVLYLNLANSGPDKCEYSIGYSICEKQVKRM